MLFLSIVVHQKFYHSHCEAALLLRPVHFSFMSQMGNAPNVPTLPSEALLYVAGHFVSFVYPQDDWKCVEPFLKALLCPRLIF